ncbi:MAG: cytochrome P450, partial [Acidimicrobiales bacterium]
MANISDTHQQRGDAHLLNLMLTPAGMDDPAPWYKRLREEMPVFESGSGSVFLTRFEDCRALLRDGRFGSGERRGSSSMLATDVSPELRAYREEIGRRQQEGPRSMLFLNPPDHTRLRGLVSRVFTPRRIEGMRESIAALTEDCLDDLAERGGGDAIDILGWLPVNVIGQLVGVPREDWAHFRALVTIVVANLEPAASLEELKAATAAYEEMLAYFQGLVAQRRAHPADDLISGLLEVEEEGDRLTEGELISTAILLFSAGMETTQNLIGNGLGA